ncbi:MAG TPA: hypothetical protein EYH34_02465 [Planctomycetes bacterium]|nr:hypothetical protein [Planctomycetota bacterium]
MYDPSYWGPAPPVNGYGFLAGGLVSRQVGKWFSQEQGAVVVRGWTRIWLSCSALCAACVVGLAALLPAKLAGREDNGS